ncbi:hypothetical protein ACHAWF_000562, partial [Thalassiosira exigua]
RRKRSKGAQGDSDEEEVEERVEGEKPDEKRDDKRAEKRFRASGGGTKEALSTAADDGPSRVAKCGKAKAKAATTRQGEKKVNKKRKEAGASIGTGQGEEEGEEVLDNGGYEETSKWEDVTLGGESFGRLEVERHKEGRGQGRRRTRRGRCGRGR